jgi:hypothetical protein
MRRRNAQRIANDLIDIHHCCAKAKVLNESEKKRSKRKSFDTVRSVCFIFDYRLIRMKSQCFRW